jgi:hypothetical protein
MLTDRFEISPFDTKQDKSNMAALGLLVWMSFGTLEQ